MIPYDYSSSSRESRPIWTVGILTGLPLWLQCFVRCVSYCFIFLLITGAFYEYSLSPYVIDRNWATIHELNQEVPLIVLSGDEWVEELFAALAKMEGENGRFEAFPTLDLSILQSYFARHWPPRNLQISPRIPLHPYTSRVTITLSRNLPAGSTGSIDLFLDFAYYYELGQTKRRISRIALDTTGGEPPIVIYQRR